MGEHDWQRVMLLTVGGIAGGFLAYLTTGTALDEFAWCAAADDHCFRNWVSALSGYFAVLAASVTAYFIFGQFTEARRQSDYLVGNLMPTASLFDLREARIDNAFSNRMEIVNWSRHPIFVRTIRLATGSAATLQDIDIVDHDAARRGQLRGEYRRGRLMIPGWRDRSRGPTFAEIDITLRVARAEIDDPAAIDGILIRGHVAIEIVLTIGSEPPQEAVIRAARSDALFVVED